MSSYKGDNDNLREICCTDPFYAYQYALYIDKVPKDSTRSGACLNPYYAYLYALHVDKGYTRETRKHCYVSFQYYVLYLRDVLISMYYEEIQLLPIIERLNNDSL